MWAGKWAETVIAGFVPLFCLATAAVAAAQTHHRPLGRAQGGVSGEDAGGGGVAVDDAAASVSTADGSLSPAESQGCRTRRIMFHPGGRRKTDVLYSDAPQLASDLAVLRSC